LRPPTYASDIYSLRIPVSYVGVNRKGLAYTRPYLLVPEASKSGYNIIAMTRALRSLLVTALVVVMAGILFGVVWFSVSPYTLNLAGVPKTEERVVVYPKEPPAFNPPEPEVRWVSFSAFLKASQPLSANVGVYARTEDPTRDPSCTPVNARLENLNVDVAFPAYICTANANDSKVGEVSFENGKYASLEKRTAFDTSTIVEGIRGGKLWLGIDPRGLPSTPLTLQLNLLGFGYMYPSPRLLNIALIGFFLFLTGQVIYYFAMQVGSGEVAPQRAFLKRLSRFGMVLGFGAVVLGVLLDVLNHGAWGMPRSTLFAGFSTFASALYVFPAIFDAEERSPA
jgi:hypothetical protein